MLFIYLITEMYYESIGIFVNEMNSIKNAWIFADMFTLQFAQYNTQFWDFI